MNSPNDTDVHRPKSILEDTYVEGEPHTAAKKPGATIRAMMKKAQAHLNAIGRLEHLREEVDENTTQLQYNDPNDPTIKSEPVSPTRIESLRPMHDFGECFSNEDNPGTVCVMHNLTYDQHNLLYGSGLNIEEVTIMDYSEIIDHLRTILGTTIARKEEDKPSSRPPSRVSSLPELDTSESRQRSLTLHTNSSQMSVDSLSSPPRVMTLLLPPPDPHGMEFKEESSMLPRRNLYPPTPSSFEHIPLPTTSSLTTILSDGTYRPPTPFPSPIPSRTYVNSFGEWEQIEQSKAFDSAHALILSAYPDQPTERRPRPDMIPEIATLTLPTPISSNQLTRPLASQTGVHRPIRAIPRTANNDISVETTETDGRDMDTKDELDDDEVSSVQSPIRSTGTSRTKTQDPTTHFFPHQLPDHQYRKLAAVFSTPHDLFPRRSMIEIVTDRPDPWDYNDATSTIVQAIGIPLERTTCTAQFTQKPPPDHLFWRNDHTRFDRIRTWTRYNGYFDNHPLLVVQNALTPLHDDHLDWLDDGDQDLAQVVVDLCEAARQGIIKPGHWDFVDGPPQFVVKAQTYVYNLWTDIQHYLEELATCTLCEDNHLEEPLEARTGN